MMIYILHKYERVREGGGRPSPLLTTREAAEGRNRKEANSVVAPLGEVEAVLTLSRGQLQFLPHDFPEKDNKEICQQGTSLASNQDQCRRTL